MPFVSNMLSRAEVQGSCVIAHSGTRVQGASWYYKTAVQRWQNILTADDQMGQMKHLCQVSGSIVFSVFTALAMELGKQQTLCPLQLVGRLYELLGKMMSMFLRVAKAV